MQALATTDENGARTAGAGWPADLALAAAGAVASLLLSFATGTNKLTNAGGDGDSLMRLVEVRDLLAGQGWFDLAQYRMGPPGGFEMHWSRLVDAPIAALLQAAQLVTGDARQAEMAAAWLWPGLLLATCLFFLIHAARSIAGAAAAFPAAMLGLAALHFMGIFTPGSFDHHNVQLALVLGAAAALAGPPTTVNGLLAGAAAALSLAVGMETAPLVAAFGAAVALAFLAWGVRPLAIGFGAGFAGVATLASLATLPPSRWISVTCDAWSGAQAGTAILAGAGLCLIASASLIGSTLPRRLAASGVLGAALMLVSVTAFPACLADPYAGLDPLLRRYWLDWVTEAQSALGLFGSRPAEAAGYFVTPPVALACLLYASRGSDGRRTAIMLGLPLLAAFAVSLWQVRGAMFSVPLAVVPLAAMVAAARSTAGEGGIGPALRLAAAWLVSFNIAWNMAVGLLAGAAEDAAATGDLAGAGGACYSSVDYAALSRLPPSTVLAVSNLGAPILFNTHHRAVSGPYHRNVTGNLAGLRALTGDAGDARAIAAELGVGIVVHCPGNSESAVLAAEFPEGLLAAIDRGEAPAWLTRVDGVGPLQIFRLRD